MRGSTLPARTSIPRLFAPLALIVHVGAAAESIDKLWVNPSDLESRELFFGPGGRDLVPAADATYRFKSKDTHGHSGGYKVEDPTGRTWKVKIGDEVGSEIAVSRILWAIGYHQPVMHFLPGWRMTGGPTSTPAPGRFRLESDHKTKGDWSWEDNPFVGSQPFRGLLVVNLLLNNWDLATSNNRVYQMHASAGGPASLYVVQDLGGSLARTHLPIGGRNDVAGFESQSLVKSVDGGRVEFDYHGPHRALTKDLGPTDVVWACRLLSRLSDRQLLDAFRAAGYPEDVQRRYVRKIREKINEGLALDRGGVGGR